VAMNEELCQAQEQIKTLVVFSFGD